MRRGAGPRGSKPRYRAGGLRAPVRRPLRNRPGRLPAWPARRDRGRGRAARLRGLAGVGRRHARQARGEGGGSIGSRSDHGRGPSRCHRLRGRAGGHRERQVIPSCRRIPRRRGSEARRRRSTSWRTLARSWRPGPAGTVPNNAPSSGSSRPRARPMRKAVFASGTGISPMAGSRSCPS